MSNLIENKNLLFPSQIAHHGYQSLHTWPWYNFNNIQVLSFVHRSILGDFFAQKLKVDDNGKKTKPPKNPQRFLLHSPNIGFIMFYIHSSHIYPIWSRFVPLSSKNQRNGNFFLQFLVPPKHPTFKKQKKTKNSEIILQKMSNIVYNAMSCFIIPYNRSSCRNMTLFFPAHFFPHHSNKNAQNMPSNPPFTTSSHVS